MNKCCEEMMDNFCERMIKSVEKSMREEMKKIMEEMSEDKKCCAEEDKIKKII